MKYIYILFLMHVLTFNLMHAQVGVNTKKAVGVFQIDGQGNNDIIPAIANSDFDDIVVLPNGNVGIGTVAPARKLHIKTNGTTASPISGLRLISGAPVAPKMVLTATNNMGDAEWRSYGATQAVFGVMAPDVTKVAVKTGIVGVVASTDSYIDLPQGKFLINFSLWMSAIGETNITDGNRFSSIFLSLSRTTVSVPADFYPYNLKSIIIPALFHRSRMLDYYGSGSIFVQVPAPGPSETTTRIYLWAFMSQHNFNPGATDMRITFNNLLPGSYGPYSQLYAVPLIQ